MRADAPSSFASGVALHACQTEGLGRLMQYEHSVFATRTPGSGASVAQWRRVTWADVWRSALEDAGAALALRVALDDARAPVAAAAAEALAALVAPRGLVRAALRGADACPLGGAPLPRLRAALRERARSGGDV